MALKKLFHIEADVDHSILHDVLSLFEGKAMNVDVRPVKHGGVDEQTNTLKAQPTAREFVVAYATAHATFLTREISAEAATYNITAAAVHQALNALMKTRVIKRVAPMTYALTGKIEKPTRKADAPRGSGIREAIQAFIRSRQNGSGEGVPISKIREALVKRGYKGSSVATTLSQMVTKKKLTRPSPQHYRAMEA